MREQFKNRLYGDGKVKEYNGDFKKGKYNGRGCLTFHNGMNYTGDFLEDEITGHGVLLMPDGCFFDGEFLRGEINGEGDLYLQDGEKYTGVWRSYTPNDNETLDEERFNTQHDYFSFDRIIWPSGLAIVGYTDKGWICFTIDFSEHTITCGIDEYEGAIDYEYMDYSYKILLNHLLPEKQKIRKIYPWGWDKTSIHEAMEEKGFFRFMKENEYPILIQNFLHELGGFYNTEHSSLIYNIKQELLFALYCINYFLEENSFPPEIAEKTLGLYSGNNGKALALLNLIRQLLITQPFNSANFDDRKRVFRLMEPIEEKVLQTLIEKYKKGKYCSAFETEIENCEFYQSMFYLASDKHFEVMMEFAVAEEKKSKYPIYDYILIMPWMQNEKVDRRYAILLNRILHEIFHPLFEVPVLSGRMVDMMSSPHIYNIAYGTLTHYANESSHKNTQYVIQTFLREEIRDSKLHFKIYEISEKYLPINELLAVTLWHLTNNNVTLEAKPYPREREIAEKGCREYISKPGKEDPECVHALNVYYNECFRNMRKDIRYIYDLVQEFGGNTSETMIMIFNEAAEKHERLDSEELKAVLETFGGKDRCYANNEDVLKAYKRMESNNISSKRTVENENSTIDNNEIAGSDVLESDFDSYNDLGALDSKVFEYIILENNKVEIIGYCSTKKEVIIPEKLDGRLVSRIGEYVFCKKEITKVEIPTGIESIGYGAFQECISLESIVIPEGVRILEGSAFSDCTSLKSITIPETVNKIGDFAFCRCKTLKSVMIPEKVDMLGYRIFAGCDSLETAILSTFPSLYENLGLEDWFFGCQRLSKIIVNSKIEKVYLKCFSGMKSLQNVVLPFGVETIQSEAFSGCINLQTVNIPESVKLIGRKSFFGCSNLISLTVPQSVNKIMEDAFAGCDRLVIKVVKGSYAEEYCHENVIPYELLVDANSENVSDIEENSGINETRVLSEPFIEGKTKRLNETIENNGITEPVVSEFDFESYQIESYLDENYRCKELIEYHVEDMFFKIPKDFPPNIINGVDIYGKNGDKYFRATSYAIGSGEVADKVGVYNAVIDVIRKKINLIGDVEWKDFILVNEMICQNTAMTPA